MLEDDPGRPVHPGELLRKMLSEQGWTHDELAMITGRRRQTISSIVAGRNSISADMALALGAAFGNDPGEWLRWGAQYELAITQTDSASVERMARCFRAAPIREMWKRGWIRETHDAAELEAELETFFGQPLDKPIVFPVATRKSATVEQLSLADKAWCFRARQLARVVQVERYSEYALPSFEKRLRQLAAFPKEARKLPAVLGRAGVRFVIVEIIPGASIDGAAFWLDEESPVIAVSARFDRIDSFWFTVMHEWFHIRNRDACSFDIDLLVANSGGVSIATATDEAEKIANESASDFLVPRKELESFARRLAPIFSKERIVQFANRVRIHPGIIVGQLQHIGALGYSGQRDFLVKVRDAAREAALTDGFGDSISPDVLSGGSDV